MKHKEPMYFRKGNIIRPAEGPIETCKSISAAKRRSREIQLSNDGKLGLGFLRVER